MVKVNRLGYGLSWIGIATMMGYSQEKTSEYVAPSEAVTRGKAPSMSFVKS